MSSSRRVTSSFSPDRKWLVTGSQDSRVLLWPADGGVPRVLPGPDGTVALGATYSPGGRWLLTGHLTGKQGADARYEQVLWDAASLEKVRSWKLEDWAPSWFDPDESRLLAYCLRAEAPYPGAAWWPISGSDPTPLGSPRHEPPQLVTWFPPYYQRTLLPSSDLNWLSSWEGPDVYLSPIGESSLGPRIWVGSHELPVQSVSLDAQGDLISSSDELETRIWSRAHPGRPLLRLPFPARSATFDQWSAHVFTGASDWRDLLVAHDLHGPIGAQPLPFMPKEFAAEDAHLSPSRDWIAIGSWSSVAKREVLLYPVREIWPFLVVLIPDPPGRALDMRAACFSPDGQRAFIGDRGRSTEL